MVNKVCMRGFFCPSNITILILLHHVSSKHQFASNACFQMPQYISLHSMELPTWSYGRLRCFYSLLVSAIIDPQESRTPPFFSVWQWKPDPDKERSSTVSTVFPITSKDLQHCKRNLIIECFPLNYIFTGVIYGEIKAITSFILHCRARRC